MSQQQRVWISSIIGLIAVVLVVVLSPSPNYQARGILLPSKEVRTPISPSAVVQLPNRPFNGKVMGHINIERHYPASAQTAHKEIAELAKRLSAQVGANGFVVSLFRIGQVTSTTFIYVFQATAYYSPTVKSSLELSRQ